MAKEEIKKLIEDSKKSLDQDKENFSKSIKDDLSDFKKKASDQTKKLKKEEITMDDTMIIETTDALEVALQVATSELDGNGETSFAKITFGDGTQQNLDNFSAKRIAATYAQLDEPKQNQFRYMLNKDAATYQSALDFAIRNN